MKLHYHMSYVNLMNFRLSGALMSIKFKFQMTHVHVPLRHITTHEKGSLILPYISFSAIWR